MEDVVIDKGFVPYGEWWKMGARTSQSGWR